MPRSDNNQQQLVKPQPKRRASDLLTNMPSVTLLSVFNYLKFNEILNLGNTNRTLTQFIKQNFVAKLGYVVGYPIDLYQEIYHQFPLPFFNSSAMATDHSVWPLPSGWAYEHRQRVRANEFSDERVKQAFRQGEMCLFDSYGSARTYVSFTRDRVYDASSDLFMTEAIAPIFVVKVYLPSRYQVKSVVLNLRENIPSCPLPPEPKTASINCYKIRNLNNVQICFANFQGKLFDTSITHGEFSKIWDNAKRKDINDPQVAAIAGAKAVFESYFTWYARFTRHCQKQVTTILAKIEKQPTVDELQQFIDEQYKAAIVNNAINKKGHYVRMLTFVNAQLKILREFEQLPEISNFYNS